MTIREAIAEARQMREPMVEGADAIRVLSDVDAKIMTEIIAPRGWDEITWQPYTEMEMDKELLACKPYDQMYVHALCMEQDDRENQIGNATNAARYFYSAFSQYAAYYVRTHRDRRKHVGSRWYGV